MTTPIIHPINEKAILLELELGAGFPAYPQHVREHFQRIRTLFYPLPPEVTPEQGKGETVFFKDMDEAMAFHRKFHGLPDAPSTGPSPAAKEVANDIACKLVGGDYSLDEARALCAAIIDRKFPREEDGAKVYEVVDVTDEERYWPLGVFFNEADAMSVLDSETPPNDDNDHEDCVTIEVRSRKIGYWPHEHTTIASRTWVQQYDDEKPEQNWIAKPIARAALQDQPK